jgi:hypothetical protein
MFAGGDRRPLSQVRNVSNGTANSAANSSCLRPTARRRSLNSPMTSAQCHQWRPEVKRPPACVAGDREPISGVATQLVNALLVEHSAKSSIVNSRRCGANSQDRSLFSMNLRLKISRPQELANSLGNGAPGRARTCDPRLRRPPVQDRQSMLIPRGLGILNRLLHSGYAGAATIGSLKQILASSYAFPRESESRVITDRLHRPKAGAAFALVTTPGGKPTVLT